CRTGARSAPVRLRVRHDARARVGVCGFSIRGGGGRLRVLSQALQAAMGRSSGRDRRLDPREPMSPVIAPALELRAVSKQFGLTEIIRSVFLQVPPGERHAIIGPNGAGKSTLFNLISGRFEVTSGTLLLNGADITSRKPFAINRLGLSR